MKQTKRTSEDIGEKETPYIIGQKYLIRTVTMIYTGKLEQIFENELVLSSVAWIAETKRWTNSVLEGQFNEVEPYPKDAKVIIGRGAILDATTVEWNLPVEQK